MVYCINFYFRLAKIQPGEIVCDPMGGGGSIPIEGALAFDKAFHIGGDYNDKAVDRYKNNLKEFGRSLKSDLIRWDATCIPLRPNSVDVLVSDLVGYCENLSCII